MDEDMRTIWCGNLSEKVTEEILYELFLQGGPIQRIVIPKDRDGKQRAFGFVTYKHINSVPYALSLLDGTKLFNRAVNISPRKNIELPPFTQTQDQSFNMNHMLQLGQQMILGNDMSHLRIDPFGMNMLPSLGSGTNQRDVKYSYEDDRRSRRNHPYHRSHNNRSSDYTRHDYKNNRRNYR